MVRVCICGIPLFLLQEAIHIAADMMAMDRMMFFFICLFFYCFLMIRRDLPGMIVLGMQQAGGIFPSELF